MQLVEIVGLSGFIVAAVSAFFATYALGRRSTREESNSWKSNYDAEHTRAERMQATLVEKDQIIEGMGERLQRLDVALQTVGGTQVAANLVEAQKENLKLFGNIIEHLERHDRRAEERHRELVKAIRGINGKE